MSAQPITDLASKYDPAAVEAEVYADWLKNECFKADPSRAGEPYSIVIPPPNVTGALHLGHAINNTLQDILTRVHRMRGFNTVWIPGIDHAGIATQAVVERQLKENENKTRHDVGRECLVKRIWAWKEQYGDRILNQLQRLGCSCDWSRTRFTLDEMCARAVRETFFKLFRDGLVYRGKRLVNWDTHLLTSISDDELYDEPVKTNMWSIKYPISGMVASATMDRPTHMTVATTRPETMLADTAVAVHSQDPRWNWAIGMSVELPLTGRKIPIIADDILVDPTFGSGVVKVTPAHDPNDYAVYTRHLGKPSEIAILNLMTPDGKVNDADPSWANYAGLTFAQARKKIIEDLTAGGFHNPETDVKPHEANVKFSDRSKTTIQPYLSDQWFVKMAPLAEPALEVVRDGTIKFFPERHAQQYLSWLGEKRDWPISRQLWWGHRIPVWAIPMNYGSSSSDLASRGMTLEQYRREEIDKAIIPFEKYFRAEGVLNDIMYQVDDLRMVFVMSARTARAETAIEAIGLFLRSSLFRAVSPSGQLEPFPEVRFSNADAQNAAYEWIGAFLHVDQDPDVLDTWFSSALWPHSTLGWPEATADLARWYPTSVLMTGRDIITLWVARMVMLGMYNMGSPNGAQSPPLAPGSAGVEPGQRPGLRETGVPFAHVAINPTILDGKGERMSKSKGNGVDPVDIIDTHGADALRFTMTTMATETQDARMPVQAVCPHCGERFDNPEGKAQIVACPKCKKKLTRPFENAKGTEEAPLCRMTSKRFDEGRNFCTKLWNAGKFALSNIQAGGMVALATMPLTDRWIMSRFNRAVDDSNAALAAYRFDQYARACYDFFWRDFCDWYVEAAKPAMKDPARSAQTANVLATVLDGALRLMHPMVPFITERLWWQLNLVRPERGTPPSEKLVLAKWPTGGAIDSVAEETFGKLQEIIAAVRNVRNEYKINKAVTVSFSASGELAGQIQSNRELIETLAVCSINLVQANLAAPKNSARASAAGIDVFVENVIDPDAEKIRITKQIETTNAKRTALQNRLASPAYTDKAPAHLVQQTRNELAAVEAELEKLAAMLKELQ